MEMSYLAATSLDVGGHTFLYNHSTNKKIPLPVIDSTDMVYVVVRKELEFPFTARVLVDEAHDIDDLQILLLEGLIRNKSHVMTVDDLGTPCSTAYNHMPRCL